jgi:hypothetical protein
MTQAFFILFIFDGHQNSKGNTAHFYEKIQRPKK